MLRVLAVILVSPIAVIFGIVIIPGLVAVVLVSVGHFALAGRWKWILPFDS